MKASPSKQNGHLITYIFFYIAALLAAHWLTVMLTLGASGSGNWAVWFDLDREYNIPTITNAILLSSSGVVSLILAIKATRYIHKLGWFSFGLLFNYLGLDEVLIIHEQLAEPTRKLLNIGNTNPLYHAWVVPGIFVVAGLSFLLFIIKRYRKDLLIFTEALKYLVIMAAGVVALEILGTFVYDNTAFYRLIMVPTEEIFELCMAVLILKQMLRHFKAR